MIFCDVHFLKRFRTYCGLLAVEMLLFIKFLLFQPIVNLPKGNSRGRCFTMCGFRTPGGCRHIDGCLCVVGAVVEAPEELGTHLQSTRPAQTLDSSHLVVTETQTVSSPETGPEREAASAKPTLFSTMAMLSFPRAILEAKDLNSGRPRMGRYSWFSLSSCTISCSTFLTTGRTQGLLSSVLYAAAHTPSGQTSDLTSVTWLNHLTVLFKIINVFNS